MKNALLRPSKDARLSEEERAVLRFLDLAIRLTLSIQRNGMRKKYRDLLIPVQRILSHMKQSHYLASLGKRQNKTIQQAEPIGVTTADSLSESAQVSMPEPSPAA